MAKRNYDEDFEIQDDVKVGSADYYLEKAQYFWDLTNDLLKQNKIDNNDYENSMYSFNNILHLHQEYNDAPEENKSKKKNDLIWAVAKYSAAVLYLEEGNKSLLSW